MEPLYGEDLAYIHAVGFGGLARGAAPEIVRRLKSAAIAVRRVVEVGCGSGALTAALVEAGFEVTGIDCSADLLGMARAAVPQARFVNASIYEAEMPACEAMIGVGEVLAYHPDPADADRLVWKFFQRAATALPAGGVLIFDLIETGEPSLDGRFWKSGEDWAVLAGTEEDTASRTVVRRIETFRKTGELYRRGREIHRVRLFDTSEVCHRLAGCGFATETAQSYGAQPLPPRRRAFFCIRREASITS